MDFTLTRSQARGEALLSLVQLADSFFPTGMYTTSSGLESLFYAGRVKGARALEELADSYLRMQIGLADCIALGNAFKAASKHDLKRVQEIDQSLYSMKLPSETREASARTGRQMLGAVSGFVDGDFLKRYHRAVLRGRAPGTQAVALGVASSVLGMRREDSAFVLLYSSLVAIVGAALRLGIIDHQEGQRIIHRLKPTILELAANSCRNATDMRQFFPLLEVAQMTHERIESKMFLT